VTEIGQPGVDISPLLRLDDEDAVSRFLALTAWEVEREANRQARRSPIGTTWLSLSKLMQRRGYRIVAELGRPAAVSWGVHLGVIPVRAQAARSDGAGAAPPLTTDPPSQPT
jgi:hypothetical protein